MSDEQKSNDARMPWLEARVQSSYKHLKMEKFKKGFSSEDNIKVIKQFFDEGQNMV